MQCYRPSCYIKLLMASWQSTLRTCKNTQSYVLSDKKTNNWKQEKDTVLNRSRMDPADGL